MTARPTQPRSDFLGTWHREFQLPLQGVCVLQFYNLQEGDFWNPSDGARAQQQFDCPADPVRPRWNIDVDNFLVIYNQRQDRLQIQAFHRPENSPVFLLDLTLGVFTPGYNDLQEAAGNFSFGGTVTMQWKGLPL